MKYFLLVISWTVVSFAIADDHHLDNFDKMRIQTAVRNDRLFQPYYKCLMDLGGCDQNGLSLKRLITEAFSNGCDGCHKREKSFLETIKFDMIRHRPNEWIEINKKYVPN